MKYNELIDACIDIRKTWDPIAQTLDAHADEYLKKVADDNEKVFIKQVFFGTYRYEEFIKVFNAALFKRSPGETKRDDAPLNAIFLYLICFRLNELPFEEFKKFVLSQDPLKMHVLFQFLFNIELLNQLVRDDWCKIYDADYIDDVIIGGIEKRLPVVAELLATVSMKATGKLTDFVNSLGSQYTEIDPKANAKKPTVAQPFKLTQPKVKALPEPIKIPKIVKSTPVPTTTYKNGLKEIEDQKKKRKEDIKEAAKKQLEENKANKFEFETEKRPTNLSKIKEEVEKEAKKKIEKKSYYKPAPVFDHSNMDIKVNAATVLKEEAILRKAKKEEEDYIKQVEMNMRDSQEYEQWKKEMQDKDALSKLELQERRRVEMQLAREAAIKAVEGRENLNKENVQIMKEMSKEHRKEIENKMAEELEYKKQLKSEIVESKENAAIEKQRVLEENKKKHDEMKKHKKERWFMKMEEDEIEKKKKDELIQKIRELERKPKERPKTYDPSETAGHGLLEEMSVAELREKLEDVKRIKEEEAEKKRIENLKKKETKEADLRAKAAEIQAARQEQASRHAEKRQKKLKEVEDEKRRKEEAREKSLLEVHGKITKKKEDKQVEMERIGKELREIKLKRQYLNADKAILEAKAWGSLEDGAEREIKARQNVKLMEQEGIETIKLDERKTLAKRAINEVEEKLEFFREYDRTLAEAQRHNEVLFREEREAKKKNHEEIRKYEQEHLENMMTRDPFKTKITAMSLSNAKSTLQGRNHKNPVMGKEEIVLPPSKYAEPGIIIEEREGMEH